MNISCRDPCPVPAMAQAASWNPGPGCLSLPAAQPTLIECLLWARPTARMGGRIQPERSSPVVRAQPQRPQCQPARNQAGQGRRHHLGLRGQGALGGHWVGMCVCAGPGGFPEEGPEGMGVGFLTEWDCRGMGVRVCERRGATVRRHRPPGAGRWAWEGPGGGWAVGRAARQDPGQLAAKRPSSGRGFRLSLLFFQTKPDM